MSTKCAKATWLVPDDYGGGVISVAQACCREAGQHHFETTLLLLLLPEGHASEFGEVKIESLGACPEDTDSPARFIDWLKSHPQEAVFLNGCEQVDDTPPYIPTETRAIYVVHDTAARYYEAAVRNEASLDAIVAVSETVARCFRGKLNDPRKLSVIHNGSVFPVAAEALIGAPRDNDLVFLGGDKQIKGATDVIALWPLLLKRGFSGHLHWFGSVGEPLRRKISALEKSQNIVLHGRVSRKDIFDTALRSRVCLMLSRVEPFGMATIECMGMGCGVVAWDIDTGTKEIVSTTGGGQFVSLGDYPALANHVLKALDIPEEERISIATRVRNEFSEAAMWSRYEVLLQDLLASPVVARPKAGGSPPPYKPPRRLFQKLPPWLRRLVRNWIGNSPRLSHALRDIRGK